MRKKTTLASFFVVTALFVFAPASGEAQTADHRLALVIGNSTYQKGPLATAANDAGLISQTLTTAGFDVTGAANLDQEGIRLAFKDFLGKVKAAGPHTITFVYLAGYGLQYAGDNFFVPVDATLERDTDVPVEAIRIADYTRALAGLPLDGRIFVLDAARANPFGTKGNPLAGGLALADVEDGGLFAMNAAPGTVAPMEQGPYGAYAQALTEMLRYGGVPIDEAFDRARLRTNELSKGAFLPWDVSKLTQPIILLAGNPDAKDQPSLPSRQSFRSRPIRDYPTPGEAYAAAVEMDSLAAYQEFLSAYGSDPLARRVRVLLAIRREALTWDQTVRRNSPDAYWSYMRRYPRGPHYYDARRRLVLLSAPLEPPPRFDAYDFQGLPPPPEDEYEVIDRPVVIFEQRDYPPPPPPPIEFLPPLPKDYRRLPPPEAREDGYLPAPPPIPLPFARPAQRQGEYVRPNFSNQRQQGTPDTPPGGANPQTAPAPAPGVPQGAPPQGPGPRPQGQGVPNLPNAGPQGRPNPQTQPPQVQPPQGQPPVPPQTFPQPRGGAQPGGLQPQGTGGQPGGGLQPPQGVVQPGGGLQPAQPQVHPVPQPVNPPVQVPAPHVAPPGTAPAPAPVLPKPSVQPPAPRPQVEPAAPVPAPKPPQPSVQAPKEAPRVEPPALRPEPPRVAPPVPPQHPIPQGAVPSGHEPPHGEPRPGLKPPGKEEHRPGEAPQEQR